MRKSTIHSAICIFTIVLGLTVASQASARYFHNPSAAPQYKVVKIEAPAIQVSVFGTFNTSGPEMGMLRIPMMPSAMTVKTGLFDGGHEGDDDTSGGNDTSDNGGNGGDHGHDGDTTDMGGGHGHDGDNDTTGGNLGDTTDSGNAGDTSHCGDHGGNGGHDGNDTVDCGHHHADDDTTAVGDTTLHTLFGGGPQSIIVKSHNNGANVVLQFTNNLTTSVTVSNMSLVSGKYFTIVSGAPRGVKPARLSPGRSISVKVAFKASDYALHTDQLQVMTNSQQAASTITLSGVQVAAASVSNSIPAGVTITALPNPMTSRLKVDLGGVNSAAVVIYDISGKTVLSTPISASEWIWNGTSTDGSMLLSGTYIVRISGMSTEGAPYVTTQKIVLAR